MKIVYLITGTFLFANIVMAQFATPYEQQKFCKNLEQVLESGRKENFESISGTNAKQSAILVVPGYSIHLPKFPVIYVDKDKRFIAKTNLNMDSLTSVIQFNDYKDFVYSCLDTSKWKIMPPTVGDDSSTVFITEHQTISVQNLEFFLTIASEKVAEKVYSILFYLRRRY
ncbi:MAG: hypothetical protein JNK66_00400 [Chitinophagales bacterium]|nr:hypothetical protein [Chitinophagales bacterium]